MTHLANSPMAEQLPSRVYIAHSGQPAAIGAANVAASFLSQSGLGVYYDPAFVAGNLHGDMLDGLLSADVMVPVLTAEFFRSAYCNSEVAVALSREIQIVPILLEPLDDFLWSVLQAQTRKHYIDASACENDEARIARIKAGLEYCLELVR